MGDTTAPASSTKRSTLKGTLSEEGSKVRARWAIGDVASGDVKVRLSWEIPTAGSDGSPTEPEQIAEFCIDAKTLRAIDREVVGWRRVDLVLSPAMASDLTLVIKRDRLPVSLCAKNVKKKDAHTFEIRGRKNLEDKRGQLPILFSATI